MSLLFPQTHDGTVRSATPVSSHGDRYVDLAPGERVSMRFTMGVMVRVAREVG